MPVGDDLFQAYRRLYAYDPVRVDDSKVEEVDDANRHWRRERVSYRAAYGNERVPAWLYIPRNATPPYQAIIYFPGSDGTPSSKAATFRRDRRKCSRKCSTGSIDTLVPSASRHSHQGESMALTLRRNLGMLVLGIYLLIIGIAGLFPLPVMGPVLPVLALLAGGLIILGK